MKKIIKATLIILLVIATVFLTLRFAFFHCYAETTVVDAMDEETDMVYCITFTDFIIEFEGIEDWQLGDYCTFIMFDNFTRDISDDIVISKRYDGWLDGKWGRLYTNGSYLTEYYKD